MYSEQVKKVAVCFKDKNKKSLRLHKGIIKETCFLSKKSPINRRCWHVLNNTKNIPKCLECNNEVKWDQHGFYKKYCSNKCSSNSKTVQNKRVLTNLDKYGVEYPIQLTTIKNKFKKTCLNKYGVDNPTKCKDIQNKVKTNWKNKNLDELKGIKYKTEQTNLKKYGVKYPLQLSEIKNKQKQTCLKKYNVNNISQLETIKNQIKINNLKKFGVEYPTQKHLSKDTLNKIKDKTYLTNQHHNLKKSLIQISKELGICQPQVSVIFKKYNIQILTHSVSEAEKEILSFIKSIYSKEIIINSRSIITPLELDIYLPEEKLAIEFNGLYWHSDKIKPNNYHFNKSKLCNDKNIKLIHIFEDDWNNNKNNIKYWLKKYVNKDNNFITKEVLIKDLDDTLELSLNWPINYEKLEILKYTFKKRLNPEKEIRELNNQEFNIYNTGKVIYLL